MQAVFSYTMGDVTYHADAVKVRRILLSNTDGRAWTYIRELALAREKLESTQNNTLEDEANRAIARVSAANLEGILAQAAVIAFEQPPFNPEDGSGCTELEAMLILAQYMEFAAGKD